MSSGCTCIYTICNVYCSGNAACVGLIIYGDNAQDVNIDTDGHYQIELTKWTDDSSGNAYTSESDANDTSLLSSKDGITSYDGLIVVICLLLLLCICLLIIGFCIHTRKIKDLESKLVNSSGLMANQSPSSVVKTKQDGAQPEIEVSFDMKNANTNQAIVAQDSD